MWNNKQLKAGRVRNPETLRVGQVLMQRIMVRYGASCEFVLWEVVEKHKNGNVMVKPIWCSDLTLVNNSLRIFQKREICHTFKVRPDFAKLVKCLSQY